MEEGKRERAETETERRNGVEHGMMGRLGIGDLLRGVVARINGTMFQQHTNKPCCVGTCIRILGLVTALVTSEAHL